MNIHEKSRYNKTALKSFPIEATIYCCKIAVSQDKVPSMVKTLYNRVGFNGANAKQAVRSPPQIKHFQRNTAVTHFLAFLSFIYKFVF